MSPPLPPPYAESKLSLSLRLEQSIYMHARTTLMRTTRLKATAAMVMVVARLSFPFCLSLAVTYLEDCAECFELLVLDGLVRLGHYDDMLCT